jgi:isopenicillin-N N-acyltransferase-like protein
VIWAQLPQLQVPILSGDARTRGRLQALGADASLRAKVQVATVARAQALCAEGRLSHALLEYVAAQYRFHQEHDPDGMSELQGIAEGFDLPEDMLFLHLHLGTLRDILNGALLSGDGCSAFAVGDSQDGPFVAKNRDFTGTHLGVQRLFWHEGTDIVTGGMLCLGSLGSPGAYSSGMNAAGLALADTQIGTRSHAVGWLRYLAMTRILATCHSVPEALDWLEARPHAGGGAIVLADRHGATASVELGVNGPVTSRGVRSWNTNHFRTPQLGPETLLHEGSVIDDNSALRLGALSHRLSGRAPGLSEAAAIMSLHRDSPEAAPVCQHSGAGHDTSTLSSVIYAIAQRRAYFHDANPCAGNWHRFDLPQ